MSTLTARSKRVMRFLFRDLTFVNNLINAIDIDEVFTATTPADWNGSAPTSLHTAVNRLASAIATISSYLNTEDNIVRDDYPKA